MSSKLIIVAGPTASGKTKFAIELARRMNGELVNADSRQVYKYMDIGTNKGDLCRLDKNFRYEGKEISAYNIENSGIRGWLFDLVTPDQEFTLADYVKHAEATFEYLYSEGKTAVMVGGTGLYIDALINGYQIDQKPDHSLRKLHEHKNVAELQNLLIESNLELFEKLNHSDQNNPRRLIRLLEKRDATVQNNPRSYEMYYPLFEREELYKVIDERVEQMFELGFVEEVEKLLELGYRSCKPMNGMGYRELVAFLDGKITLEIAKERIKQVHRNYARRQITWFEGSGRAYELILTKY